MTRPLRVLPPNCERCVVGWSTTFSEPPVRHAKALVCGGLFFEARKPIAGSKGHGPPRSRNTEQILADGG
jgi:hypothetical protein